MHLIKVLTCDLHELEYPSPLLAFHVTGLIVFYDPSSAFQYLCKSLHISEDLCCQYAEGTFFL